MLIERKFTMELPEIEEDHPDQIAEYKQQMLERSLLSFIGEMADEFTLSVAEERNVRFNLAMRLLESFQGDTWAEVIKTRLGVRRELARASEQAPDRAKINNLNLLT